MPGQSRAPNTLCHSGFVDAINHSNRQTNIMLNLIQHPSPQGKSLCLSRRKIMRLYGYRKPGCEKEPVGCPEMKDSCNSFISRRIFCDFRPVGCPEMKVSGISFISRKCRRSIRQERANTSSSDSGISIPEHRFCTCPHPSPIRHAGLRSGISLLQRDCGSGPQ